MAEEQQQEKKAKPLTFAGKLSPTQAFMISIDLTHMIGLTALAQALDSKQAKTSFGRLPLSDENSQPIFGFP